MLETYRHFGLRAAPFDGRPDPCFFYRTPAFAEILATLQYAVGSGKTCTLVLGDSGSGKTLLGRVLAQHPGPHSDILWLRGLGQPPGKTVASVVSASGPSAPAGRSETPSGAEVPLVQWLRAARAAPLRPVVRSSASHSSATLIVDDADGLRPNAWEDILALLAEPPLKSTTPRVSAVIFGLPALLDAARRSATTGPLVRLQRRVFRVCHLVALGEAEVADYVRHRLATAGGTEDLFTPPALALVYELSGGNPALINQICDNALVEAFGEDQPCVDTPHVLAAARSVTGERTHVASPSVEHSPAANGPIPEESLLLAQFQSIGGRPAASDADPLQDRLHNLQARLTAALSRVRTAVGPASTGGPASGRSSP